MSRCAKLDADSRQRIMVTLRRAGETLDVIGKVFGLSRERVSQITDVGITYGRSRVGERKRCPISDQDLKVLADKMGSVRQVARFMKAGDMTVSRWLREAGLRILRTTKKGHHQKKMPERQKLEKEYNRRTCIKCAEFFGVTRPTLNRWIDIYDIPRKGYKHASPLDKMSVTEIKEVIAEHGVRDAPSVVGVHFYTLASKLEELGIYKRPIIEDVANE